MTNDKFGENEEQEKQGGICCRCCCDYRRAVIVMSIISIILYAINLASNNNQRNINNIDDDELREEMKDIYNATASIILDVVGIIVALVSILGAVRYNKFMVGIGVAWAVISTILYIVFSQMAVKEILEVLDDNDDFDDADEWKGFVNATAIISYVLVIVIASLWVYPSVFLIKEISSGVMSAETYAREKSSCCCS